MSTDRDSTSIAALQVTLNKWAALAHDTPYREHSWFMQSSEKGLQNER